MHLGRMEFLFFKFLGRNGCFNLLWIAGFKVALLILFPVHKICGIDKIRGRGKDRIIEKWRVYEIRFWFSFFPHSRKVLNEDLEEMFPGCSGDLSSTKFNPEWFLLENHYSTSYDDLRAGLAYLRRKVETQKMGQISFLKVSWVAFDTEVRFGS